ncbi:FIG000325: clustered with transcription termination protein NusA [Bathymodiolus heckerae thiotrophic gill symbiont]|uniref:ribosome maturation factor RimP n=1 Tax=Bathymodiolus heckerae thiotrophic gill symbiont TaxID=1052212 RepID=UPI0010AFD6AA|nr:ribosome maturation factor RimP [Bathymodiolus heckerae thiotrophic gill symbiont]CAC9451024.1 Bacterial ribosome SSU maturation protein RimP [uncultured Gammaproteobacteria bacterium]SMN12819.1 FIG000325: clustered with transcription termination protein NusA [Bathymodiolus heckerae thiotrophic gill symbiont]SMN14411.1 FIG000325: clustered with transcription termination protein NusA [uncultured Candidatus Thioglobus sp.]
MARITDKIETLIRSVIEDMSYELVGVEYIASGKHSILRVYIDSDNGIGLDDCEQVSHQCSSIFDVEDPIAMQYNLEVSSPGVERPLFHIGHYQRFLGHDIKLRLLRPLNGQRKFNGAIGSVSEANNSIELMTNTGSYQLDIEMIEKANLVAHF